MTDFRVNDDVVEDLSKRFTKAIGEAIDEHDSVTLPDISIAQGITMTYTKEKIKEEMNKQ